MRRLSFALATTLATVGGLFASMEACTFLVTFDDVEAGATRDAAPRRDSLPDSPPDEEIPDATAEAAPPVDAKACDESFPLDEVDCNQQKRPNCAKNTAAILSYPAGRDRTNDLVVCNGGARPTCVRHCPNGCAIMPDGFEDECDPCSGRVDGYHCGKDLDLLDPKNADIAIECKDGHADEYKRPQNDQCPNGVCGGVSCGVGRCASSCPTPIEMNSARPACCVP